MEGDDVIRKIEKFLLTSEKESLKQLYKLSEKRLGDIKSSLETIRMEKRFRKYGLYIFGKNAGNEFKSIVKPCRQPMRVSDKRIRSTSYKSNSNFFVCEQQIIAHSIQSTDRNFFFFCH